MKSYTINYSNGTTSDNETFGQACRVIESRFGDCITGEWESVNTDREDRDNGVKSRSKILVWGSEDEANNDDGSNAVAEIWETVS